MASVQGQEPQVPESSTLLSVVVPVFNEISGIADFWTRLEGALEVLDCRTEVIFVDNCSDDGSSEYLQNLANEQQRVKYVRFSRNFGPRVEASITAGLSFGSGDAYIIIYSDLQDPPELIPQFVEYWMLGYDVVYGVQQERLGEKFWRRILVKAYYRGLSFLSDIPLPPNAGDFRLLSSRVVSVLLQMPEVDRYTRGLVGWIGFEQISVPYVREPRHSGESKAGFWAILGTAWTGITGFSLKPLRLMTGAGAILSFVLLIIMLIFGALAVSGASIPGLTSIIVFVLFGTSLNLLALGLMGEYLGRIHTQVKGRPLFVVSETINIPETRGEADEAPRH